MFACVKWPTMCAMIEQKHLKSLDEGARKAAVEAILAIIKAQNRLAKSAEQPTRGKNAMVGHKSNIVDQHKAIERAEKELKRLGLEPQALIKEARKALKKKRGHWSEGQTGGPGVVGMGSSTKHWKS